MKEGDSIRTYPRLAARQKEQEWSVHSCSRALKWYSPHARFFKTYLLSEWMGKGQNRTFQTLLSSKRGCGCKE